MVRHVAVAVVSLASIGVLGGCDRPQARAHEAPVAAAAPAPARVILVVPRREEIGRNVVVEVLADGEGPALVHGGRARLHYTARAVDAAEPFASTSASGVPFEVELGRTAIVPGLARALEGRRAGARLVVHVPAAMAWKDSSSAPVPAGTDVIFEVDVLSVR